jgi:uncharacterized protein (TIGR02452 family)
MAQETLSAIKNRQYTSPSGKVVHFSEAQQAAKIGTKVYRPQDLEALDEQINQKLSELNHDCSIEVQRTDSLAAAAALAPKYRTVVHNFASAKNPGGGFLTGAKAQEEDLSRNSGLYTCLADRAQVYYNANRKSGTAFYTDHIVYSPSVPVIRGRDGQLLETPWYADFITVPAVNAGAVRKNEKQFVDDIESVMRGRLYYTLGIAMLQGAEAVVTGAWGCGVFQNEPSLVARLFSENLSKGGVYSKAFKHVTFGVLDKVENGKFIGPFQEVFG